MKRRFVNLVKGVKRSLMLSIEFFFPSFPVIYQRYKASFFYDKNRFKTNAMKEVFSHYYDSNAWASLESKSGGGSTLEATKTIRRELPLLLEKYSIQSMLDVPCGDYNWMKEVQKKCIYVGGDIVENLVEINQRLYASENVQFRKIDITEDVIPKVDLIFCKDCLQHLSYENVRKALMNFKKSNSEYLLVTSYPLTWRNHDIYDGDFRPLNLLIKPFELSGHILTIKEDSRAKDVELDKTMYLFKLKDLFIF